MIHIISIHVHERVQVCSKEPKTMLDSGETINFFTYVFALIF
jgi:hypothetical protein